MVMDFANGGQEAQLDADGFPAPPPGMQLPDAETQPEALNALTARALGESAPEPVVISGPPDGSAQLLAGYVDPSGNRWRDVELRELRGRDEEALAKASATGDMTRYIDAILRAGVVRVGEVDDEAKLKDVLDGLLVGDRELLVMQVRRLAFGDTIRLGVKCPFCEHAFEVDYSFGNDVPLKQFEIDGVGDPTQRLFNVELPSGALAEVRMVDGKAQKIVYSPENVKKTDPELNTLLLTELLVSISGKPVRGPGPVLDMPVKDRAFLLRWLTDNQPGPQYGDVKQECPECIRSFPLVMTLSSMFRGD